MLLFICIYLLLGYSHFHTIATELIIRHSDTKRVICCLFCVSVSSPSDVSVFAYIRVSLNGPNGSHKAALCTLAALSDKGMHKYEVSLDNFCPHLFIEYQFHFNYST